MVIRLRVSCVLDILPDFYAWLLSEKVLTLYRVFYLQHRMQPTVYILSLQKH